MKIDQNLFKARFKGFVTLNSNGKVDVDSLPPYHKVAYKEIVEANDNDCYVNDAINSGCILAWENYDRYGLYLCSGALDNEGYPVLFLRNVYNEDIEESTYLIKDTSKDIYNVTHECLGIKIEDAKKLIEAVLNTNCCICGEPIESLNNISPAFSGCLSHTQCKEKVYC